MHYLLIIAFFLFGNTIGFSQEMFIEQVAGKEVVREAYNDENELTSKQKFVAGPLDTSGDRLSVNLRVKLYNSDGQLTNQYTTKYSCEPSKADMLLKVFPFAREKDADYVIDVSFPGIDELYDIDPGVKKLNNLKLKMSIESGILGFFGSKNIVSLTDRRLKKSEEGYTLNSTLTVEAYLMGLKVKSIQYQVTEKLNQEYRLQNQLFRADGGSYFIIKFI